MDYDDAKATFAERSGLVDKARQFSDEQLEDVYRCLGFTKDMNDNLKHINDSKGHIWGDKSLKQFAKLLQRVFYAEDIIGRFGGDEFVVFMKDIPLAVVTSKIEVFRKHLTELNGDVLTCSIGAVYITSATNKSFEEIFKLADYAMNDVKKSGKNGFMINEI